MVPFQLDCKQLCQEMHQGKNVQETPTILATTISKVSVSFSVCIIQMQQIREDPGPFHRY